MARQAANMVSSFSEREWKRAKGALTSGQMTWKEVFEYGFRMGWNSRGYKASRDRRLRRLDGKDAPRG